MRKDYYFVPSDEYGQHGTEIQTWTMIEEVFMQYAGKHMNAVGQIGAFFETYSAALAYTQD